MRNFDLEKQSQKRFIVPDDTNTSFRLVRLKEASYLPPGTDGISMPNSLNEVPLLEKKRGILGFFRNLI